MDKKTAHSLGPDPSHLRPFFRQSFESLQKSVLGVPGGLSVKELDKTDESLYLQQLQKVLKHLEKSLTIRLRLAYILTGLDTLRMLN
jgi:hypothetical protein